MWPPFGIFATIRADTSFLEYQRGGDLAFSVELEASVQAELQ